MLLELTSDYVRFLHSDQLKQRKVNLDSMNALLESQGHQITKTTVRRIY